MEILKKRINNTNDEWDRNWGISFLTKAKGRGRLKHGGRYELDIQSFSSNYGADVEKAHYDPMERDNDISIPYRKDCIGRYWWNERETDYIQFVKGNDRLIFISSDTIKKYRNNPIHRGNIPLPDSKKDKGYHGYTLEESKIIWNSYIEIPKEEVEVWVRDGYKGNWKWCKL